MLGSIGVVDYPTFLIGSLLIILCPGPNSLYVLRTSVAEGARVAFAGACAIFLGDSILLLATYLGVAALILAHPSAFFLLKCAGAAYLTWLAFRILSGVVAAIKTRRTSGEAASVERPKGQREVLTPKSAFKTALVLSLSNPKAILFMLSFFLPFINAEKGHPGLAFLVLALTLQFWSVCYLTALTQIGKALLFFFGRRPLWGIVGNGAVALLFLFFAWKLVAG